MGTSMKVGTSHFVSFEAAVKYYRPYGFTTTDVERKIQDGEIHIGLPQGKNPTTIPAKAATR